MGFRGFLPYSIKSIFNGYLYFIPLYVICFITYSLIIVQFRRKKTIATALLIVLLLFKFLHGWIMFYHYKNDTSKVDLIAPDCFFAKNFPDYYSYLTKGCHLSIYDIVFGLFILAVCYISVFVIVNLLYTKRKNKIKTDQFLIDN